MEDKTFSFEALAALSGLPTRTVRYYIQRGLVERPVGTGRWAHYTPRHLAQLLEVRKWTEAGLSLERIAELANGGEPPPRRHSVGEVEVRSHVRVAEGIELVISPDEAAYSPEDVRELTRRVLAVCREIDNRKKTGEQNEKQG